jgi:hypothetical protein
MEQRMTRPTNPVDQKRLGVVGVMRVKRRLLAARLAGGRTDHAPITQCVLYCVASLVACLHVGAALVLTHVRDARRTVRWIALRLAKRCAVRRDLLGRSGLTLRLTARLASVVEAITAPGALVKLGQRLRGAARPAAFFGTTGDWTHTKQSTTRAVRRQRESVWARVLNVPGILLVAVYVALHYGAAIIGIKRGR